MVITDSNLENVITSNLLVVIDFWASWCVPCRTIAPIITELETEYQEKIIIGKYNVDENNIFSEKFDILGIPAILFFKNGELVDKIVGATGKKTFVDKINKLL